MKYLLLLSLFAGSVISRAQTTQQDIRSEKTAAHVNVPGSRLFIVPPQGFTASAELPALENGDNSIIEVLDIAGGNFYTNAATFNRAAFESKGIKVLDYRELKVNGYPAKMIVMLSPDGLKVFNLVFGDTTFSATLMSACPQDDDKTSDGIQKAIQTVCYDKSFKVDPFAQAVFVLEDGQTSLKFVKYTASTYIYALGGQQNKRETLADDNPVFMVTPLPAESSMPEIDADVMLSKMREKGITILSMEHAVTGRTGGLPSFQREIYAMINNKKTLLYQHVVIIGKTAVIMQGEATGNFPTYLKDFQALSNTIRKK